MRGEDLPFPDGAFDLIVSQYGIEYSALDRSVPEMLRILAAGGRIALLLHAHRLAPRSWRQIELAHLDWLLSDRGLLWRQRLVIEPLSRATTAHGRASLANDPMAEAARERFNAAQDRLRCNACNEPRMVPMCCLKCKNAVPMRARAGGTEHGVAAAQERLGRHYRGCETRSFDCNSYARHALTP